MARTTFSELRPDRLAAFLASAGQETERDVDVGLAQANGGPVILVSAGERAITALLLDVVEGRVAIVHLI